MNFPGFKKPDLSTVSLGSVMKPDEFKEYLNARGFKPLTEEEAKLKDNDRMFVYDLNENKLVKPSELIPEDKVLELVEQYKLKENKNN